MKRIGEDENWPDNWPDKADIGWYSTDEIICNVNPPIPVSNRAFALSATDINSIKRHL